MNFKEYYKNKQVVNSYDLVRRRGLKGDILRNLELKFVDFLIGNEKKNQKILEIGIGTGFISKLLVKKGKFYGIDISKEMINKAKINLEGQKYVKLMQGDILNLKIKENFDKIVSIRVISHLKEKEAEIALKKISSILKKGGYFIFNIENLSFMKRIARKIMRWGSTPNYQYTFKKIKKLISKNNLKIDKIIYLDHTFILPLHFINKIMNNKLSSFIIQKEFQLRNIKFMSTNSFIRCKK